MSMLWVGRRSRIKTPKVTGRKLSCHVTAMTFFSNKKKRDVIIKIS